MKEKPIITLNESEMDKPELSNTFRVAFSEDTFLLDFGYMTETEKDKTVQIVSRVVIPPKLLNRLMLSLFTAGEKYEKRYNKNIGFHNDNDEK